MNNGGTPFDIGDRTLDYGLRTVRLYRVLREARDGAADVIAQRFLRPATSVRANVAEGKGAQSEADFIHKHGLAQKEARESLYWLCLLQKAGIVSADRLDPLVNETNQLVAIITWIIVRTKKRAGSLPEPKPRSGQHMPCLARFHTLHFALRRTRQPALRAQV